VEQYEPHFRATWRICANPIIIFGEELNSPVLRIILKDGSGWSAEELEEPNRQAEVDLAAHHLV